MASKVVLRAYLKNVEPQFKIPRLIAGHLVLRDVTRHPIENNERIPKDVRFAMDVIGIEERISLDYVINAIKTIRIGTSCSVTIAEFYTPQRYSTVSGEADAHVWNHLDAELSKEDIRFVENHFDTLMEYLWPETYTRVGNALRLHESALLTQNCDLALLGFVGAIESLFSISPQELSFRLSFLLAKFLGKDKKEQRKLYERAKSLYTVRSKIAHGDKLDANEEAAAIQIVDYWTPEAEELARECLKQIFELKLAKTFDNRKAHEALLTDLLFAANLGEILATGTPPNL